MQKKNRIVFILGQKGSGKSSYARQRVRELSRVIVLDPMSEYSDGVVFEDFPSLLEFMERNHLGQFRAICRFRSDEEYLKAIELCLMIGSMWIVVEELNYFITAQSKEKEFLQLFRFGRHYNVSIMAIAQRAAEVPKTFTSQADEIISFRQVEPRDLKYMSQISYIGSEGALRISLLEKATTGKPLPIKNFIIFA